MHIKLLSRRHAYIKPKYPHIFQIDVLVVRICNIEYNKKDKFTAFENQY